MAPAMSSLPVPLSPRINTVASVGATVWMSWRNSRTFGDSPTMFSMRMPLPARAFNAAFSARSRCRSAQRPTACSSSSGSKGLAR